MTILFKGIPFCTRPETGILEGVMLPAVARTEKVNNVIANGVKQSLINKCIPSI